ncbi:MAG: hypothetical protein JW874_05515 [Spirochaetales bacterium]|nr:hypothetical protein [Spirochaetales bacterium]
MNIEIIPGERIGQTLVRIGALQERQLQNILIRQNHGDSRKFGRIAVALHYLRPAVMSKYLRALNRAVFLQYRRPLVFAETGPAESIA